MTEPPELAGLRRPLRIAGLELANRVLLAPLAGVSDVPFRRICQEHGAGLTSVEMLSAVAIVHRARRTESMMARHPDEPVLGVQLTGAEPEDVARGAGWLAERGFDLVDLNMGCPVRKIVAKGWGAALLKEPERVAAIVARCREVVPQPLTAKIRLGYLRGEVNVADIAARIAAAGADLLTIHGRSRGDDYQAPVNYSAIRTGVQAAREAAGDRPLVTVGNGNVMDPVSAAHMVRATGCDAVMVSRGALGNPWIFPAVLEPAFREPTVAAWRDVVIRHIAYHGEHYGDHHLAAVLLRKHLLWYLAGFPGVKRMRAACSTVGSLEEARDRVNRFADRLPADLRRYATSGGRPVDDDASFDPKHAMDRRHDRGIGHEDPAAPDA